MANSECEAGNNVSAELLEPRLAGDGAVQGEAVSAGVKSTCVAPSRNGFFSSQHAQRRLFYKRAQDRGVEVVLMHFTAPYDVLRARIAARQAKHQDPSEADVGQPHEQSRSLA